MTTIQKLYSESTLEHHPCPICHTQSIPPKDNIIAKKGFPEIPMQSVMCMNCGLIRINPRMSQHDYERFYKEVFFEYLDPYHRPAYVEEIEQTTNESFWTPTRKNLIPYLLPWVKTGARVLDIGAGFGSVLYYLQKECQAIVTGLEPDPESNELARTKIGINLLNETAESFFTKNKDQFDVIILNQTFEHLLQPIELLIELKKRLSPNGFIYIGVPNAYAFDHDPALLHQLAHTYNFSPASLSKIVSLENLRIFDIRHSNAHPIEALICHENANYPKEYTYKLKNGIDTNKYYRKLKLQTLLNSIKQFIKKGLYILIGKQNFLRLRNRIIH